MNTEQKCEHCKGDIKIRNPKGFCDHLYYPDNCDVCSGHTEQKGWRDIDFVAMNIVHQIGDALYDALSPDIAHEHFVDARQSTNDIAIAFAAKLIERTLQAQREELLQNIGMLRQWLNEDRIQDAKKMVTNEDIKHWLIKDKI